MTGPGAERRPRSGLNFAESAVYGLVFAISLSAALAFSPIWKTIPAMTALLPARYGALLESLPVAPNTALAFLAIAGLTYASLGLLRHPTVGLALLTAVVLGFATYPYGHIRWHRLFIELPLDSSPPGPLAWGRTLLPVILLTMVPLVLQSRALLRRYGEKKVDAAELERARQQMVRSGLTLSLVALVASSVLATLLFLIDLSTPGRFLARYSVVALLLAAMLLVAAIGIGTGAFGKADETTDEAGAAGAPASEPPTGP